MRSADLQEFYIVSPPLIQKNIVAMRRTILKIKEALVYIS
jgi:hypothetical protein